MNKHRKIDYDRIRCCIFESLLLDMKEENLIKICKSLKEGKCFPIYLGKYEDYMKSYVEVLVLLKQMKRLEEMKNE